MVVGDTGTGNICSTTLEGIFKSVEGANKKIKELIPYEKRRAARSLGKLTDEEVEQALERNGIKYKLHTYSDGVLGFTMEDERNDITTFLNVIERVLED